MTLPATMCAVQLVAHGGPEVLVWRDDLTLYGATHQPRKVFEGLISAINAGSLRPLVSQTYPLREIARAQDDLTAGRYPGKLVLLPPENAA